MMLSLGVAETQWKTKDDILYQYRGRSFPEFSQLFYSDMIWMLR